MSDLPCIISECIDQICAAPIAHQAASRRPRQNRLSTICLGYESDQTGDDHRDNQLSFSDLVILAAHLARILRRIKSDYHREHSPPLDEVAKASSLLHDDTIRHQSTISVGTACCANTDPVKRNTILRALILFSLGGKHAAEYLQHSVGDRVAWIVQLNTSACWIKVSWERHMAQTMIRCMEEYSARFKHVCEFKLVYEVVFNHYFLMLFSRRYHPELRSEMDTLGVGAFSWHDLFVLREAHFKRQREGGDNDIL
jgi:hypothetical protein